MRCARGRETIVFDYERSGGCDFRAVRAVTALSLAVACTRVAVRTETGRHPWTIPHVLRITRSSEPDSLNPIVGFEQTDVDISMFWAGYLFNRSDENRFVPELATVVPTTANGGISPDGRTIVYHLRPQVKWQDGAPFGADDIIFSYRSVMNPRNAAPSRSGYERISRIDKVDDHTIAVHLTHPWAHFVDTFFTLHDVGPDTSRTAQAPAGAIAALVAGLAGVPLGVLLTVTDRGGVWQNIPLNRIVVGVVNPTRSRAEALAKRCAPCTAT